MTSSTTDLATAYDSVSTCGATAAAADTGTAFPSVTESTAGPARTGREMLRRLWEDGWGRNELDLLPGLFAPTVAVLGHHAHLADQPPYGADVVREEIGLFRGAFPDLTMRVSVSVTDGQWTLAAWEGRGTHTGPLLGLEPSGRTVHMAGAYLARVVDGRITEARHTVDTLGYTQQVGAVPGAEEAPQGRPTGPADAPALPRGLDGAVPGPSTPGDGEGRALVRRLFDEVLGADGDIAALAGLLHPGRTVQENVGTTLPGGFELAAARHRTLLAAAPDARFRLEHLLVEGDLVGYGWSVTGTHTGPLAGTKPTGRPFTFNGTSVSRVVDGRLADTLHRYDALAIFDQIGRVPPAHGTLNILG
ncbi:ester cyclase [Streptomyces sp. NRRL B-24572]|uniref:ester cyclase n=1 Tax=Streptomyces sp. NRRL B-24572 TaxID=1962156 RepID=UPI000A3C9202|nr:ester cyclase [Streptomyces sp. NRRL B-24572]